MKSEGVEIEKDELSSAGKIFKEFQS